MATLRFLFLTVAFVGVTSLAGPFCVHGFEPDGKHTNNVADSWQMLASNDDEAAAVEPSAGPTGVRVRLRSEPNMLSVKHIVQMIRDRGFSHPYDLSEYELAGRFIGDFQHDYEPRTINGEQVVVDHATGLMWQAFGSSKPLVPWQAAKNFVQELNQQEYGGFSDWRLPTIEELASLLEPEKKNGSLHIDPVFGSKQHSCWSADQATVKSSRPAWVVYFRDGAVGYGTGGPRRYVRAVRSLHAVGQEPE